jgi:ABC-type Mn2+/Zn2+ transport system permease subunit
VGYVVGVAGYVGGLIASSVFDLPTGAVIVVTLAIAFAIATMLAKSFETAIAPAAQRAEVRS